MWAPPVNFISYLQLTEISHEFNTRSLRAFVARCMHAELHGHLFPLLRRAAASGAGAPLDLQDALERFAFDNICHVAFDHDPRQLPDPDSSFADAFRDAANLSAGRFRYAVPGLWKIKKALNVGSEKRLRESVAMLHGFADRIIQSRREEMQRADFEKHDLLSRFMASQDETYSESEVPLPLCSITLEVGAFTNHHRAEQSHELRGKRPLSADFS